MRLSHCVDVYISTFVIQMLVCMPGVLFVFLLMKASVRGHCSFFPMFSVFLWDWTKITTS